MSASARYAASAVLLVACAGGNAGQARPQACAPVEAPASGVSAEDLAGAYEVLLLATRGAKKGDVTSGRLELMQQDTAYRALTHLDGSVDTVFSFPLYGAAEIDFAAVGATAPGDPGSTDPLSPGVLVIAGGNRVMLRVGSESNRRDVRRFDGAYTVLQVQQVTDQGFAGTWRSGLGLEEASGHFCAVGRPETTGG